MVDLGNDGDAGLLTDSASMAAALSGDDQVASSGSFAGANGNTIDWTAASEIALHLPRFRLRGRSRRSRCFESRDEPRPGRDLTAPRRAA
jgi:hypothetical protein